MNLASDHEHNTFDDFAVYPRPNVDDLDINVLDELRKSLPDGMKVIIIIDILSSGNSVAEYIPLENYKAKLVAGHKYGKGLVRQWHIRVHYM